MNDPAMPEAEAEVKPIAADELTVRRADSAGLRAELANLRRQLDGCEGTMAVMRFYLNGGRPPASGRDDQRAALRFSAPAGRA
jgi:hypothetical protein